ncbi:MAG: SagB/ThcOx family dehydrogenase [Candidatus Odinarchaeota archaeon]
MSQKTGQEFMKKTQYKYLEHSDQMRGLPQPPLELPHDPTKSVIDLPTPASIRVKDLTLRDAIERRQSVRKYSKQPLTLVELSWLLWCMQGVKEVIERPVTLRNVPSAGARHAFETYVLVNNVKDLQPGLYRFIAISHKLEEVNLDDSLASKLTEACLSQSMVKKSAVTFFLIAVAYRMKWRYSERGYRYLHLDAGHVFQNLYLAAENIDCGTCAVAAFDDEKLNELLGIDGVEQFAIYLAPVGKK